MTDVTDVLYGYTRICAVSMTKWHKLASKWHTSITVDMLLDAEERRGNSLDNPGFCIQCGNEQESCEPDARGYECEACGGKFVYGAAELLINIL